MPYRLCEPGKEDQVDSIAADRGAEEKKMETRTCKRQSSPSCKTHFEPDFARQVNCNECKKYDLAQKNKSRAKQKAAQPLTAWEWLEQLWASPDYARLNTHLEQEFKKIENELGTSLNGLAGEAVRSVLSVSFGFKNGITRQVSDPKGLMVGTYFPDVIGRWIVSRTHKYGLESSATFSRIYRELLSVLDKKFGKNADSSDDSEGGSARAVKAELSGTYVLPAPSRAA